MKPVSNFMAVALWILSAAAVAADSQAAPESLGPTTAEIPADLVEDQSKS